MKFIRTFLPALFVLAIACKHGTKSPENQVSAKDSAVAGSFLPVKDFITSDIKRVDSFAGGILKRRNIDGKKDSAFIHLPEFHQLADEFLLPELDSVPFSRHFTESSLMDQTTQMLNFIYTTRDPDWPLQKVIVYIAPSLADDKVKRLYMEKQFTRGDTSINQKLNWVLDQYFYILTIRQPKAGPAVTSVEKVIWDPQHFSEE